MSSTRRKLEDTNCTSADQVASLHQCTESVFNPQFSIISNAYTTSLFIPECVLRQKYLADSLSMRQIASEFACSKTHVRNLLLKYKIPLREQSKYRKESSRIYGKRKVASKVIDHKGELRTITAIKRMYAEGVSTRAIARFLDAVKIPTKQQGKGWHNYMIIKILERDGVCAEGRGVGGKE